MDGYLEHGKFKYIDKYKSKAGKWVYRYASDLKGKAQKLNDKYGSKTRTEIVSGGRPKKNGPAGYDQKMVTVTKNLIGGRKVSRAEAYQRSEFESSKKDKSVTGWSRNDNKRGTQTYQDKAHKFAGDDAKRYKVYRDWKTGVGGIRTEYKDSKNEAKWNAEIQRKNAIARGSGFIGKLGKLNDKYGPKIKTTTTRSWSTGHVFVDEYTRNLIGGKTVKVESYNYEVR